VKCCPAGMPKHPTEPKIKIKQPNYRKEVNSGKKEIRFVNKDKDLRRTEESGSILS